MNSWLVEVVAKHVHVVEPSTVAPDQYDLAVHLRCHRDVSDLLLVQFHLKGIRTNCDVVVVVDFVKWFAYKSRKRTASGDA